MKVESEAKETVPPLLVLPGSGEGGVRSPEGSVSDERQAEEQTERGAESSEDSGQGGETQVRR